MRRKIRFVRDLERHVRHRVSPLHVFTDPPNGLQTLFRENVGKAQNESHLLAVFVRGRQIQLLAQSCGCEGPLPRRSERVDIGPEPIIGEASYAMAELFGIDPDPATGGAEGGVTYIVFTGSDARVREDDILDHGRAVSIGKVQAVELLKDN